MTSAVNNDTTGEDRTTSCCLHVYIVTLDDLMYINHEVYNFEKYCPKHVGVFGMTEICQQGAIFEVDLCIYIFMYLYIYVFIYGQSDLSLRTRLYSSPVIRPGSN